MLGTPDHFRFLLFMFARLLAGFATVTVVASQHIIDLNGKNWTLTNSAGNVSIPGSVPSHAHLDLLAAGVIDDPYYGEESTRFT